MDNQLQNRSNSTLELRIYKLIGHALNTKYNWSLIIATMLIGVFTGSFFPYSNTMNFGIVYLAGLYLFKPISIFSFLLLVKSIWLIAVSDFLLSGPKLDNSEIDRVVGKVRRV